MRGERAAKTTHRASAAAQLEGWGRASEAIEIIQVRMEAGHPMALNSDTSLLARHGRAEEAFTVLRSHIGEPSLAVALGAVAAWRPRP
ncbi:hypothetical protein ACFTUC_02890 [Streptomyces sp. NPDC056944]|uniref:hypothetical protein n=1 Tax=Streptomyces sp. NPDC056944 TaxID=3345972 RepID=UPI003640E1AA